MEFNHGYHGWHGYKAVLFLISVLSVLSVVKRPEDRGTCWTDSFSHVPKAQPLDLPAPLL
jgi:hypothetical protein